MKIDTLKDIIKRYPKEYAAGYALCKKHNGSLYYYHPPYSLTDDRRTAWTRGWGDCISEIFNDKELNDETD